jgi:hypothetical protein
VNEAIAADARPGREVVLIAVGCRGHHDVVQIRKLSPDPGTGVILIGNRVDAELRHEVVELGWRPALPGMEQRLSERVRSTPGEHPQRARIGSLRRSNNHFGAGARLVGTYRRHTVPWLPCHDDALQRLRGRKTRLVLEQPRPDLVVGVDQRVDHIRPNLVPHPRRCRRDQPLDIEVIRVHEEPNHGHLVVRLVRDVGHDDNALFFNVWIDARRHVGGTLLCDRRRSGGGGPQHHSDGRKNRGGQRRCHESHAIGDSYTPLWSPQPVRPVDVRGRPGSPRLTRPGSRTMMPPAHRVNSAGRTTVGRIAAVAVSHRIARRVL